MSKLSKLANLHFNIIQQPGTSAMGRDFMMASLNPALNPFDPSGPFG